MRDLKRDRLRSFSGLLLDAARVSFCHRQPDETIFRTDEAGVKRRCAKVRAIKQRGSVMLDIIISLFYRQSCKASLSAIRTHKHLFD